MSVDPYMRLRIEEGPNAWPLGGDLNGGAVGEVILSKAEDFAPGDLVLSNLGWREGFNASAKEVEKLDTLGLPPQTFLGVAGMPGLTAYAGLIKVAGLKEGDIVFVSGAAGAVGSLVCQIAKARGNVVVAAAGGPEKVKYLNSLGVDHAIDYKNENDISQALRHAASEGIDVFFDNVGGDHLAAALANARPFARFAICGQIAGYDGTHVNMPANLLNMIMRSVRMEGFTFQTYVSDRFAFRSEIARMIDAGAVTWRETIFEGIGKAPDALVGLFEGANLGKTLVKLA
jgi:NADPH-dependent curcumin reductase CurA